MTATKRRGRRQRTAGAGTPPATPQPLAPGYQPPPLPSWKWKTLPVYLALTGGIFLGFNGGLAVGASGNSTLALGTSLGVAVLLGFGLSRVTTKWMVSRNWVSKTAKRKK